MQIKCLSPQLIREIDSIREIVDHLEDETLLLLDIDNTLIEPSQWLGSERWLYSRIEHYHAQGIQGRAAFEVAHIEWMSVQGLTEVRCVEEETATLFQELQERGVWMMGLTARNLSLSAVTSRQLASVGIDFKKTAPHEEGLYFHSKEGVLYRDGILFASDHPKHQAFSLFSQEVGMTPKHVVLVDDKHFHLLPFSHYASQNQLSFVGLRYGFLDEKIESFDPDLASHQWEQFGTILSDDEAKKALLNKTT